MKLRHLKYFEYICEEKSFTKTAEKYFVSQPVLSNAVKSLEEYFGVELIERKKFNNEIKITEVGYKLLDIANKVNQYKSELDKNLNFLNHYEDVKIGFSNLFEHRILEDISKKTVKNIKHINNNSLIEDDLDKLHEMLLNEEIDICIAYYFNKRNFNESIASYKLKSSEFKIFANKNKKLKLTKEGIFDLKNLDNEIILCLKNPIEYYEVLDLVLKKYKITPKEILYIEDLKTIEVMIENDLGISFLDEESIKNDNIYSKKTNFDEVFEIYFEVKKSNENFYKNIIEILK